jgi:hypothetical protein
MASDEMVTIMHTDPGSGSILRRAGFLRRKCLFVSAGVCLISAHFFKRKMVVGLSLRRDGTYCRLQHTQLAQVKLRNAPC